MKLKYIIGGVLIIGFAALAVNSFAPSLRAYVSIEEAMHTDNTVQVKGERADTGVFDIEKNMFTFKLKDKDGRILQVVYAGPKPGNFDQAKEVVCVGTYQDGTFHATELLVKCPSKYQEMES
ncbi:MAG: cytochrome c maturation protein CcmE [Calditrichaeota bacterium]|nr:MAG: cytochrome c maturation protein CcmE [Calditrichota bacterium]